MSGGGHFPVLAPSESGQTEAVAPDLELIQYQRDGGGFHPTIDSRG